MMGLLTLPMVLTPAIAGENLKPYTLATIASGSISEVQAQVSESRVYGGFEVLGAYSPMGDPSLAVICVTHPLLKKNAQATGGLLGFAAALRVGMHQTEAGVEVAFTTPAYWGNAYYRGSFPDVASDYAVVDRQLQAALTAEAEAVLTPYGSEDGLSAKKLRKYHYMMAMPYFDDVVTLQKGSYDDLTKRIEDRIADSDEAATVYAIKLDDKKMALFGIALTGKNGEAKFLPRIDFASPRATPFLPYELLVLEDRAVMLHGKYRIALSFPDLSMGTFMKIVSTPGDIADALRNLVSP